MWIVNGPYIKIFFKHNPSIIETAIGKDAAARSTERTKHSYIFFVFLARSVQNLWICWLARLIERQRENYINIFAIKTRDSPVLSTSLYLKILFVKSANGCSPARISPTNSCLYFVCYFCYMFWVPRIVTINTTDRNIIIICIIYTNNIWLFFF